MTVAQTKKRHGKIYHIIVNLLSIFNDASHFRFDTGNRAQRILMRLCPQHSLAGLNVS